MEDSSWYFTAAIVDSKENIAQVSIHNAPDHLNSSQGDLAISRNWMEYIEFKNSEGPGAYDVLRCDLIKEGGTSTTFKVWGQDYHLKRLEDSYKELDTRSSIDKEMLKMAHEQSADIVTSLLSKMVEHEQRRLENGTAAKEHDIVCEIVRLTLLWTPTSNAIIVRGHASTSGGIMVPYQTPKEIVATLALPKDDSETLPERKKPHAKISSWSRKRRPLENKESFMPEGVGEVLLLHRNRSHETSTKSYEILEGMTSNFFAIYHDGTIRTARDGILFGYVRHLVIDCASACGLKLDNRPVNLNDGRKGLWAETFITSSSRLIYPIKKILVPDYGFETTDDEAGHQLGLNWKVFWEVKSMDTNEFKWNRLLKEILKRSGYHES
jgi:hypothetical protein